MLNKIEFVLNELRKTNVKKVERDTEIPATRMYKWLDGKGNPKASDLDIIFNYLKNRTNSNLNVNIDAETKNKSIRIEGLIPSTNMENKGVPYYDVDFMGGFDLVFNDQAVQPSFYIDFLPFNDCDCWINVSGKSMGPLIAHGDIVGLKIVDNWRRFLLEGEIYAVITDNGFRTIKMLGAGPDKDHYTLIPYNKSEEYKPQVIPKDVITHIFRVKGNIKKFF